MRCCATKDAEDTKLRVARFQLLVFLFLVKGRLWLTLKKNPPVRFTYSVRPDAEKMIQSFKDRDTETIFNRQPARRLPPEIHRRAYANNETKIAPVHPGEILLEDVLKPLGLSQARFADMLGVPANRINAIIRGQRSITADTAVRLSRCLGTSAEFWLGLQAHYDLDRARDALEGDMLENVEVLEMPEG